MRSFSLVSVVSWLLAAFLLFGSYNNGFPTEATIGAYVKWGYPAWFHYVTAALELTAALLLLRSGTRLAGAAIATVVMLFASGTLIVHAGVQNAVAPLVTLAVSLAICTSTLSSRRREPARNAG